MGVKKTRRRKRPSSVWRVLFGQHGPTKKALKKAVADMVGPKTVASIARDPKTGKLTVKNVRVDKQTGAITIAKPAKKKAAAAKASRASTPSKPSHGGRPQRRTAAVSTVAQAPRLPKSQPMSERALRNPDGTLAGSTKDPRKTALEYQRIMQHVEKLNRQTDRDLGWDRET